MAYLGKTNEKPLYYGAFPDTFKLSRSLRRRMTPAEKVLWESLRSRKLCNYKFRRQHPVREFIVDFYCHEKQLVIEVDGEIHRKDDISDRDVNRSAELERMGIKIIRFRNDEVLNELEYVLKEIETALTSPSPPGEGAGG